MSPLSPLVHPADRLEAMLLIRAYELRLAALAAETGIPGTCSAVGQEAAAVGVVSALTGDDLILTNHRSAGHLLARGVIGIAQAQLERGIGGDDVVLRAGVDRTDRHDTDAGRGDFA